MSKIKILSGTFFIAFTSYLAFKIFRKSLKKEEPQRENIVKVLFFPDAAQVCAQQFTSKHGCYKALCKFSHDPELPTAQLLMSLMSCTHSLDVCVFVFTSNMLADIVINFHKNGINVRVISDGGQPLTNSQIHNFRKEGISVRTNKDYLMHHKFVIIDDCILINGSFNWTSTAVAGNNENLLITNDEYIVQSYSTEFRKLWELYKPPLS